MNTCSFAKYQKMNGDLLKTSKSFQKKSHSADTNRKGDPLVSSDCLCFVKKLRGGLPDLAGRVVLVVSVKSVDYAYILLSD